MDGRRCDADNAAVTVAEPMGNVRAAERSGWISSLEELTRLKVEESATPCASVSRRVNGDTSRWQS